MAATSSSSTSLSRPSPPLPPRSPLFTHIEEEEEDETELPKQEAETTSTVPPANSSSYKHLPTPLHPSSSSSTTTTGFAAAPRRPFRSSSTVNGSSDDDDHRAVSCINCRPSSRDKIFDINVLKHPSSSASTSAISPNPNTILRSLFLTLTRKSPRNQPPSSSVSSSASSNATAATAREEEWKRAAVELSRKLLQATRKRDEALLEVSRLKYSMSELELKLDRLASYCHDLKSTLDHCTTAAGGTTSAGAHIYHTGSLPVEPFLCAVSDARSAVRHLGRSFSAHLRQGTAAGSRSLDRIASFLQPYEARVLAGQWRRNPRSLLFYMEALLSRVFYGEFERTEGEEVDPAGRCEVNRAAYEAVRGLAWEEVLSKGTRHYSEGLSRFCDRKMSEVVGMLGWARAWPESLLQSFFGAAKGAWMVHLLAHSVHPPVPIIRVSPAARFDPGFMEDVAGNQAKRLIPVSVRMMVSPGFYVYSSSCGVVKCKVLCAYSNESGSNNNNNNNNSNK